MTAIISTNQPLLPQLVVDLHAAESVRKKIVINYSVIGFVLFAGLIIEAVTWMSIAVAIIILFVLVYTRWYGIPVSTFEKMFITTLTQNTINCIQPSLKVDYQEHLKLSEIRASGLLENDPDYFSGKNLIYSEGAQHQIRISEIYAHWKQKKPTFPAQNDVFNGLVAIADFPFSTGGKIQFSTNQSDISQLQSSNPTCKSGQIGKHLFFWGDETLDINNDKLVVIADKMNTYYEKHGKKLAGSIADNKLSIAIINDKGFTYIAPSVVKTVFDYKAINRYYTDLSFLYETVA
jgi:hypothetical protein